MKKTATLKKSLLTLAKDGATKLVLKLKPRQTVEFAVQTRSGGQPFFTLDVIQLDPEERGNGVPVITWSVSLQWWDGFDGKKEWRKVARIENQSRSEQRVQASLIIHGP